ncbi:hypothetical protein DFH08DRAFT_1049926 [Mycena albidolilacea]|uniref:Uncharacterized protein n=1 Tax=Mycena albidolilacea TaxID=1033008 RepID=A0AAD6Z6F3_9AGAR|nr:hypothetical protein DFH08DRAFT_1049926 [Mycena albidolilacea]
MSNYAIEAHLFATYYDTALLSTFGTCGGHPEQVNNVRTDAAPLVCRGWLVAAICVMGLFAAVQLALQVATTVLSWRSFYLGVQGYTTRASSMLSRGDVLDVVGDYLLVANNILTDGLFLHRCYVIWGRNMKVVIVPALSLTVTAGASQPDEIGDWDHHDFRRVFGMMISTNLMLMAMTAGRIWWIRHDVVSALEPSATRVYDTIIAMILESGAIYCISILLYLVSVRYMKRQDSLPTSSVFRAAIPQIMNIAPILLLVRADSGSSAGDETSPYGIRESSCWTQHSLVMDPANVRQPEITRSAVEGHGR